MKKRLVKALALGCVLLGASATAYAADVEIDGHTKISAGSLLIGDGIQGTDDDEYGISFADGTFQNTKASNCWDTNGNEACDGAEDVDGSGTCDALDCKGAKGDTGPTGATGAIGADSEVAGPQGADGSNGLNCWDLNNNGLCDQVTEDTDGTPGCDALDCQGPAGTDGADGADGADGTGTNYTIFTTTFPTFDVVAQGIVTKTINCGDPALNLKAISGGYKMTAEHALVQVVSSYPEDDGWIVEVKNYAKNMRWSFGKIFSVDMTGYAVCVPE